MGSSSQFTSGGLQVCIVGAGIAGLSTAIAQRKAGHHVEIFEQSTFKNEIGAAISLTPNGSRVVEAWGFDHAKAHAVESQTCQYLDGKTLEITTNADFTGLEERFGHAFYHYHRVDLHASLRKLALDPTGDGPTPRLHHGSRVADIDCGTGKITLDDGRKLIKDLVIVADGIWSKFPSIITQTDKSLSRSPRSVFRTLIPMQDVLADADLQGIFDSKPLGFWAPMTERTMVVTYPCRNNTLLNIAILHDTLPGDEDKVNWNSTASLDEVLTIVRPIFHDAVVKLVSKAKQFAVYKIMRRDLVETLVRGRAALVGDAAHWMFPTHAQGAVCGIQEAAAIATLTEHASPQDVQCRLKLYNELMLDHVHVVQLLSNYGSYDLAQSKSKKPIYPRDTIGYTQPVRDFFYDYDVFVEARRTLEDNGIVA